MGSAVVGLGFDASGLKRDNYALRQEQLETGIYKHTQMDTMLNALTAPLKDKDKSTALHRGARVSHNNQPTTSSRSAAGWTAGYRRLPIQTGTKLNTAKLDFEPACDLPQSRLHDLRVVNWLRFFGRLDGSATAATAAAAACKRLPLARHELPLAGQQQSLSQQFGAPFLQRTPDNEQRPNTAGGAIWGLQAA